uniref:JHL06B08.2 protein n=1 Tax=Jatropha curcas TaxID=180498 RepID=E6NU91_JATCU|nr:JHL06B08.2 [Jatropha curcas]
MVKSKPSNDNTKDMELLKTEVASFASSLGLSSSASLPSSGFNDADFRKSGPLKKSKPTKPNSQSDKNTQDSNNQFDNSSKKATNFKNKDKVEKKSNVYQKPEPKPPVLSLDDNNKRSNRAFEKFKNLPKLPLVKAGALGVWYEDAMELEKEVLGEGKSKLELKMGVEAWKVLVEKKKELGERLMWQYTQDYEQSRGKSGEIKMAALSQRSGTAVDKVHAFSLVVVDNPIANLRSLDALLGMVTSKVGKRHALRGFDVLEELFTSSLLPDRKLKTLLQRPVNSLPETKDGYSLLLFWYWEDCLKQRYERFVFALEEASRDALPILKDRALKIMYALLNNKSEQERRLLSGLVNKLGDPQNRGASNADFHLSNLLSDHPNMKVVVIDEVDSFLFRPHLGLRAKYHAVNFLSQIRLSHKGDGPKVAKRLIDVYFALFKVLISEVDGRQKMDKSRKAEDIDIHDPSRKHNVKDSLEPHVELDSRLLSALLTGINRAFPYVSSSEADDIIEIQTPMLFRLVHSKNFNVGVQALMLLDKISSRNQIVSDRFYRALYSKLLLPAAMNSSKVSLQQPPQYACGCLFLLSEVLKARPPLWNMVIQNESVDEDLEHFKDVVEETDDEPHTEVKVENNLVSVQNADKASPENDSSEGEDDSPAPSSDDDEDDDSDEAEVLFSQNGSKEFQESKSASDYNDNQPQISSTDSSLPGGYNPRHREPSYCNADRASWWELMVLASHVHPSVATMARTLISGANIVYNGNPLNDLSLTAFLDKFMEKKPKQTTWHGGSQIEPAKKLDMNNHLIGSEILSLAEVDVPPEDLVFHKFYMNKMNSSKPKKKKKKAAADEEAAEELFEVRGGDEVGGGDESDNEEIENMLDSADLAFDADGDYDYDDLDQVANEDDDDLIGNASDVEMDDLSDIATGEDFDGIANGDSDDDVQDVDVGDVDDGSDEEDGFDDKRRKRKSSLKVGASPFANLEDYEHLLNEENPGKEKSMEKKKPKSRKKKKSSK